MRASCNVRLLKFCIPRSRPQTAHAHFHTRKDTLPSPVESHTAAYKGKQRAFSCATIHWAGRNENQSENEDTRACDGALRRVIVGSSRRGPAGPRDSVFDFPVLRFLCSARRYQSGLFSAFPLRELLFQCGLLGEDGVDLVVEVFDHDLRLEVDLVIVLRAAAVFFLLPVLAHHDERRLNGRHAGEHQIEQDEGVRVECPCRQQRVDDHP